MEATTSEIPQPHIIMLPSPGMGHLIPLIELAKRLVSSHGFTVTLTIPTEPPSAAQTSLLDSLPTSIKPMFLPPVDLTDLPADVKPETVVSLMVTRSLPSLSASFTLITSTRRVVAFVADIFGSDAFDVAVEFNVRPYIFFPSTAMLLSLFFELPKLDQEYTCEYRYVPGPIQIPGCAPIDGIDLFDPVQDRKNEAYRWVLHHAERYRLAQGFVLNSFDDLEPGPINAFKGAEWGNNPPVYPVGPLIQTGDSGGGDVSDASGCLKWLDAQPLGSVVYVSFGSVGTLSSAQLTELALGLEMSEQRFLWVARSPNDNAAADLNPASIEDPSDFLPEGFSERIKSQGLVVPSWAPQVRVLGHASTGGFLTHCGWNSTLESVVHGVPLIAWPLFAEQKMNAVMLEDSKAALRPKPNEHGIIGREEVSRVVKGLMEGEEGMNVRSRMTELQSAAARVLQENGSSAKSLEELANMWGNQTA